MTTKTKNGDVRTFDDNDRRKLLKEWLDPTLLKLTGLLMNMTTTITRLKHRLIEMPLRKLWTKLVRLSDKRQNLTARDKQKIINTYVSIETYSQAKSFVSWMCNMHRRYNYLDHWWINRVIASAHSLKRERSIDAFPDTGRLSHRETL